jgi:cold shock protein
MKGTIKKLVRERGFGFIQADDGREIFFHHSVLQGLNFGDLKEGQSVKFEVEHGDKGPRAKNVQASGA